MAMHRIPTYDKLEGEWVVDTRMGRERGDLEYVASEFAHSGLIFPYNTKPKGTNDYQEHDHYFKGVIKAVIDHPDTFSIEGLEEYYSKQEQELLHAIQQKMLEVRNGQKFTVKSNSELYDLVVNCYNSNSYEILEDYLSEDCVYRSQWVFEEMRGGHKIASFLVDKSNAIAKSGQFPIAKKVNILSPKEQTAIAISQGSSDVAVILLLGIENGRIHSFDLCMPGLFSYEDSRN